MQIEQDNTRTLQNLLDRARSVVHADSVVVVVHGDQTALPPVIASGEPRHEVLAVIVRATDLTAPIYERGTVYLQDENQFRELMSAFPVPPDLLSAKEVFWSRESISSSAIMRLGEEDDPLGVMIVKYRTPQSFDSSTKALLEAFSFMAGVAIHNQRLSAENSEFLQQLGENLLSRYISESMADIAHNAANWIYELSVQIGRFEEFVSSKPDRIDKRFVQDFLRNIHRPLKELLPEMMRVRELRKLNHFSRQRCNIEKLIDSSLAILNNRFARDEIRIEKNYRHTPNVLCDSDAILHVLLNLLINAAEAIRQKGFITVTTDVKDGYARISISDDGRGIPSELRSQVFKPFFSTKMSGKGLGLTVSSYIASKHGGKIEFTANPDRGTTFSVYLPLAEYVKSDLL